MIDRDTIIRMARLYGTPVQEQNAEVEYRFTIEELGLLLSTACVIERVACAEFVESQYVRQFEKPWREDLAAAIRARGETTSRGQA